MSKKKPTKPKNSPKKRFDTTDLRELLGYTTIKVGDGPEEPFTPSPIPPSPSPRYYNPLYTPGEDPIRDLYVLRHTSISPSWIDDMLKRPMDFTEPETSNKHVVDKSVYDGLMEKLEKAMSKLEELAETQPEHVKLEIKALIKEIIDAPQE